VQTRYPEHKTQAIGEFTTERLRSFYIADPNVMIPAISVIQEGKRLAETNHPSAALVFFGTGIELLLKATVLKPVVHGLVHSAPLADTIVEYALGQSGFDRYTKLLSKLYNEFSKLDINSIKRQGAGQNLLAECTALQDVRNKIIHRGATCSDAQAANGLEIVDAVYQSIVIPVLGALGLTVGEGGVVEPTRF
jgi:hypothetical protein